MKVYIVWHWNKVHAVCPTKDDAERLAVSLLSGNWVKLADGNYEPGEVDITEHALVTAPRGLDPYCVEVLRDGTVQNVQVMGYTARWIDPGGEPRTVLRRSSQLGKGTRPDHLMVQVWARTPEQAIDVAQQCRGRYIDQGRWDERITS